MTPTEVCNLALSDLGRPPISDIGEESVAGRYCKAVYEPTVRQLLRDHTWNFARSRVKLLADPKFSTASKSGAPAGQNIAYQEWSYRGEIPGDCVRAILLNDPYTPWAMEGRYIYSNTQNPTLYYIARVSEAQWDPSFVAAVAAFLTARLCIPITDNATASKDLIATAQGKLADARTISAQESGPQDPPFTQWETSRMPGYFTW